MHLNMRQIIIFGDVNPATKNHIHRWMNICDYCNAFAGQNQLVGISWHYGISANIQFQLQLQLEWKWKW